VRDVLADVAGLGPFFAVATGPSDAQGWRPLTDLYTDPEPLRARIGYVREVLDSDDRVAASIMFQGLATRLLSAPLAAAMVHGVLPLLPPEQLSCRVTDDGPWPLWCADPNGVAVPEPAAAAARLADVLFEVHLAPLVAAVRAQVPISAQLLWGNVASSVAAGKRLVGEQRPAVAHRAAQIAAHLLATGPLAGSGELRAPEGADRGWTFRRRSCCLFYRTPSGGLCGDCVLTRPPVDDPPRRSPHRP